MFKKTSLFIATLTSVLALTSIAFADDLTADQILDKAQERNQLGIESGEAQMSLIIKDEKGTTLNRTFDMKTKKVGGKSRSLVTLLSPKELKNQAFLFAENENSANDIWMYIPAFKITRRVEGSQKDGSFLGSHFTYADLSTETSGDSTNTREKDDKIGKDPVYVVTSVPKKSSDKPYTKVVLSIRQSDFIPLKTQFYKGDKLTKTLYVTKLAKAKSGKSYPKTIVLKTAEGGSTTIKVDKVSDNELPDSIFSKEQLGK